MFFSVGVFFIALVSGDISNCPSSTCWEWNAGTNACDLRASGADAACVYSIVCDHATGMTVTTNHDLFGTTSSSVFVETVNTACRPSFNNGEWTYAKALGTCGQETVKWTDPSTSIKYIKFNKVLAVGGTVDPGITVTNTNAGTSSIFTSTETNAVQVTFTCKFAASTTAKSSTVTVKPHVAVSGSAAEATGDWTGSMSLGFFTDNGFGTALTNDAHNVFIGSTMFVQSSWSVTSLTSALKYYIDGCTIKDLSTPTTLVDIVKDTCYAQTVGAIPLGSAAGSTAVSKIVSDNSQFSYTSFSFDTSGDDTQELECTIKFCVVTASDGGAADCPNLTIHNGAGTCPTAPAGFNFLA